jgi:outer membrane protein TolC
LLCTTQYSCITCFIFFSAELTRFSLASDPKNVVPVINGIPSSEEKVVPSLELVNQLKRLQDQIKNNSKPISLSEAIKLGLQNNPQLAVSFTEIQNFEWELVAVQREWYPNITISSGTPFIGTTWATRVIDKYGLPTETARIRRKQGVLTGTPFNRKTAVKGRNSVINANAAMNWDFIDPKRQPNINAVADSLKQQKLLFDSSARSIILSIQQLYFAIQSSQQNIESFQQIYEINQEQLEMLEAQKSIGMATVLEVEQTRSQLYLQLNELIGYTNSYYQQAAQLAEQLGLPANQLAIPDQPAQKQGKWEVPLNETIRMAIKRREEIKASLAAAESANWRSVGLLRQYLPTFSLVANGSLARTDGYSDVKVDADPANSYLLDKRWDAGVGISFNWQIFDGGILAARAQSQKAKAHQNFSRAVADELQVIKEVRTSFGDYQTSLVSVTSARQAYRSAELAQEAARARYEVGIDNITTVVSTLSALAQAAQLLSAAILKHNTAVVSLYRYSSTWPGSSQQEVQDRLKTLRDSPQPSPANSLTRLEP